MLMMQRLIEPRLQAVGNCMKSVMPFRLQSNSPWKRPTMTSILIAKRYNFLLIEM